MKNNELATKYVINRSISAVPNYIILLARDATDERAEDKVVMVYDLNSTGGDEEFGGHLKIRSAPHPTKTFDMDTYSIACYANSDLYPSNDYNFNSMYSNMLKPAYYVSFSTENEIDAGDNYDSALETFKCYCILERRC